MHIVKEISTPNTFRVAQVSSMFDVPVSEKIKQEWNVDLPLDFDWQIGLIVGPSGCGKSTVAKELWPDNYIRGYEWTNESVLDNFPKSFSSKEIVNALTAVGFSSPPDWIKPYHVLSTGQQMRCDLARALTEDRLIVFDEFTSVVDRTVAQIGSAALAKAIRRKPGRQFIAVTCHADVLDWLTPDWVYEPQTNTFARRLLQRPEIKLDVYRVHSKAWAFFKKHHYLSQDLNISAECYMAELNSVPVAFAAILPVIGFKNARRVSRIVVTPDYQGIGVGSKFLDAIGDIYLERGCRYRITTSHPGFVQHLNRSPKWVLCDVMKKGSQPHAGKRKVATNSLLRGVITFEYIKK